MKKPLLLSLSFACALAIAGVSGFAFAAEDAYSAYRQQAAPLEQQIYAKQAELDAVYASSRPDIAKAQQLFREIGDLRGRLFAVEAELRGETEGPGFATGGMHHPGEFDRGDYAFSGCKGNRGHRGGYMGGYRGHGGRHGGW